MLQELHIKNYALIESLDIEFSKGYSVITGETGAGKSIILGAIALLHGTRGDAKVIMRGAKKCIVEGSFIPENEDVDAILRDNDIDSEDICIIRREILDSGKSRAFVNDTPVNLNVLKELSALLIDIHSQHQNLLLGRERFLLDTLDAIADNNVEKEKYEKLYKDWKDAGHNLKRLREEASDNKENADLLQFQLNQLDEANLADDELENLEEEVRVLRHAEEIKSALFQAYSALDSDEHSVTAAMRTAVQSLDSVSDVYSAAADLSDRIASCRIELDDISEELDRQANNIEYDPTRLTFVEERLDSLYSLMKKHQVESVAELIDIRNSIKERLYRIEDINSLVEEAAAKAERCRKDCLASADKISASRKDAAREIEKYVCQSLKDLGMPHASIQFSLTPRKEPDVTGNDCSTLLFSANKDVPMQDVAQIASGGEISRLMLAMKVIISSHKELPTVIFDEIDTGVSGTMAEKMAVKMKQMSSGSQVICITHLPQIAAMGEHHFLVYKDDVGGSVSTRIRLLDDEERIMEIANMLSGEKTTSAAVENARALLNR